MEDMDDVRREMGVVADFSGWKGLKYDKRFEKMKFSSKERIIDEEETADKTEESLQQGDLKMRLESANETEELLRQGISEIHLSKENKRDVPKKDVKDIPAFQEAVINVNELKNIAVRLLPSVDKVEEKDYADISQKAIDMAFIFLKVWDSKVSIGGKNG